MHRQKIVNLFLGLSIIKIQELFHRLFLKIYMTVGFFILLNDQVKCNVMK